MIEQVYNQYYNTAGNYHWVGVHSGDHILRKEERERHPYVYLHGDKYCSVCYGEAYFDTDYGQQLFDYCPNCGADMRGEEE